jgi:3-oxoadipate enol-lactonase
VQAFAGEYRVVRFDLPGHGQSPTPRGPYTVAGISTDLLTVLDRLRAGRFHYAGISLGGAIGQQLAVDHADRLLSLTAVAAAARFAAPSSWSARAATVREKGTEAMVGSRPGTWFTHAFPRSHPDRAERLLSMLRDTRDEGYAGCCEAIAEFDLSARLHTFPTSSRPSNSTRCWPATSPRSTNVTGGQDDRRGVASGQASCIPVISHKSIAKSMAPVRP